MTQRPRSESSKAELDTPALLVDLDVLEANITRIASTCRNTRRRLAPAPQGP